VAAGRAKVLVTLVRAEGSSYRRPGAHLLIGADGEYAGTISGGCLEAEVVRKAAWMVRNGAIVERYSTLFDDTAEIPFRPRLRRHRRPAARARRCTPESRADCSAWLHCSAGTSQSWLTAARN
jgi:hypothetical protein